MYVYFEAKGEEVSYHYVRVDRQIDVSTSQQRQLQSA